MYTVQSLWGIFDLEFFLFGGVPETATQMYEPESHGHEEVRRTREILGPISALVDDDDYFCDVAFDKNTGAFHEVGCA